MALSTKDRVALPIAILLGTAFGCFTLLAGFGGLLVGGFYGLLIAPLIIVYVADQRKILVWQACIIPFALCVVIENARIGALGKGDGFFVFYLFWAIGSLISSPAPLFFYWKRSKGRNKHQVVWLSLGLVFVALISSIWHDPFLFLGLSLCWIVMCVIKFAWEWHSAVNLDSAKTATVISISVFVFTILASAVSGLYFKQQAFFSAMTHQYPRIVRVFVTLGADPNGRDAFGHNALANAAWFGDLNGANALISMGADVNQLQESGIYGMLPSGTALRVAAAAGRTDICKSLLDAGARVDAKNKMGATPLLVGLSRGTIACAPTLLAHGADVNATDMQGRTVLMVLAMYGENDVAAQSVLHEVLANASNFDARDANGKTADDWATDYKRDLLAEQLRSLREARSNEH